MGDYRERARILVNNLVLGSSTDASFTLKHSFGKGYDSCDVDDIISTRLLTHCTERELRTVYYLSGMYCRFSMGSPSGDVRFEKLLGMLYAKGSDSLRERIHRFLDMDMDGTDLFPSALTGIMQQFKSNGISISGLDYVSLLDDLGQWNYKDRPTRLTVQSRWANAVINSRIENNMNNEEEN